MSRRKSRPSPVRPCGEWLEPRLLLDGLGAPDVAAGWLATPPPGYECSPQLDESGGGPPISTVLYTVPEYFWHHGCGPTAGAMVLAYWDRKAYPDYFPGDASTQTAAVNEAIASKGDGSDTTADPGTPGTGHVPDYAYYDGVNDYGWETPYPDLSGDDPPTAHLSDCLADFMLTSQSSWGLTHGGTPDFGISAGFNSYSNFVAGYSAAEASHRRLSAGLTFYDLQDEIDAGRPMVLLVDSDGDGAVDHFVPAIGYRSDPTDQYACYTTWEGDPGIHWFDWRGVAAGNNWGIYSGTFFHPCLGWPDLAGTASNVTPEPLTWGQSFDYYYSVKNYGSEDAGGFSLEYYLSADSVIDSSDHYLGSTWVWPLGSGAFTSGTAALALPLGPPADFTAEDDVWIGMIVDADDDVAEGVESNNRNLAEFKDFDQVHINTLPDLVGTSFTLTNPMLNLGTTAASFTVHNGGQTAAGAFWVKFYLSQNDFISIADTYLGAREIASLAGGADYSSTIALLPGTTDRFGGDGSYTIGMIIDTEGDVNESDETNNRNVGYGLDKAEVAYGRKVFFADFEHGDGAMDVQNKTPWAPEKGLWQQTTRRGWDPGHSGTHSMYYGRYDAGEGDWDYDVGDSAGAFYTKRIELPDGPVALTFTYLAATWPLGGEDQMLVQVYDPDNGDYTTVLSKGGGLAPNTSGTWQRAVADLSAFGGRNVRLRFVFDTITEFNNNFEGWFVDDIILWSADNATTVEGYRNLKYDADYFHELSFIGAASDHDTFVFNEEQTDGSFILTTDDAGSGVDSALAVYDYATGDMLYLDSDSGPGDDAQVVLANSGRWNSYLVEVWDVQEDSIGELDVHVDGSGSFTPTTILLDADGDGSVTGQFISPDTDTDFYRVTAPPTASGRLQVQVRTTDGSLLPLLQVWRDDGDDAPEAATVWGVARITGVRAGDVYDISISDNDFVGTGHFDLLVDFSVYDGPLTVPPLEFYGPVGATGDRHITTEFTLDSPTDRDRWRFTTDAGGPTTFTATAAGGINPLLALYDGSGDLVAVSDVSTGTTETLVYTLNAREVYTILMQDAERDDSGDVDLMIDSPSVGADIIPLDAAGDGSEGDFLGDNADPVRADPDYFQFTVPADASGRASVTAEPLQAFRLEFQLFDGSGAAVGPRRESPSDGASASGAYTGLTPGETYTVCVFGYRFEDHPAGGDFTIDVALDLRPRINSLLAAPNPVFDPGAITLTAAGVGDGDGDLQRVDFYRDANGNRTFDPGVDAYLGSDVTGGDGWTQTTSSAGLHDGRHYFFARARDALGNYSDAAGDWVYVDPKAGDVNLDGAVNILDLGILAANYRGTGKAWQDGDFNGDGVVNILDLGLLAGNYRWREATGGESAVGRPAALSLPALGGALLVRRRKR